MQIVRWLAVALGALLAGAVTYSAIALIFHFLAWAGGPSSPAMEACLYFQAALFGAGVSVYAAHHIAPARQEQAAKLMASVVTLAAVIEAVLATLNGSLLDVPRSIGAMLGVLIALHVRAQEA
jgi:hypothetical protein